MRIISKFKDYYDVGMSYGADPTLVYARETAFYHSDFEKGFRPGYIEPLNSGILYFCGTAYPFMTSYDYSPYYTGAKDDFLFFQTPEQVDAYQEEYFKKRRHSNRFIGSAYLENQMEDFLKEPYKVDVDIHFKYKAPVVMYLQKTWENLGVMANPNGVYSSSKKGFVYANPILRTLNFQRVVDPYTAFQEISMFLGGVLGNIERDTVKITDDKILRDSKGFDDQSFKTGSPGKKKNRRKYKT